MRNSAPNFGRLYRFADVPYVSRGLALPVAETSFANCQTLSRLRVASRRYARSETVNDHGPFGKKAQKRIPAPFHLSDVSGKKI